MYLLKRILLFSTSFLILNLLSFSSLACTTGHQINAVIDNGKVIRLENGSLWEVFFTDQNQAASWSRYDYITACDYKLINTSKNESVSAYEMH